MSSGPPGGLGVRGLDLDLRPAGGQGLLGADLGALDDEQVVLVAEVAVVDEAGEAAAVAAERVEHAVGVLREVSASMVTMLGRLPSAGAQNSGIRVMSPAKAHSL